MDGVDVQELMKEFVLTRDNRSEIFGLIETDK
jgi:hypothetical protein